MNILIVLAGEVRVNLKNLIKNKNVDFVIAVDGGYDYLYNEGITPNIVIGDFDSIKSELDGVKTVELNMSKDYTDFEFVINYIEKEHNNFVNCFVVGFMSSKRPEHFYNNLMLIRPNFYYISENTNIFLLTPGEHVLNAPHYISFFAFEDVKNLTLDRFKYPLKNYELLKSDNVGISNEIEGETGEVSFKKGKLLVFLSN